MSAFFSSLNLRKDVLGALAALAVFFVFVELFRPLLPVDETRYLSVAWEMYLNKAYFLLTNNGEPYHHKPPLLFWLINAAWALFGISREAALVPIFLISASWLLIQRKLFQTLRPQEQERSNTLIWFLLGSFPFLIYSTMTMFDMMLSACVGATLIFVYRFTRDGRWLFALLGGLAMGVGVLAKGPAILLFLIGPVLGYAWWSRGAEGFISGKRFAAGFLLMFLVALLPVACWLVPLTLQAEPGFLKALIWKQSAGRVSGNMSGSHARPLYFYVMLLPVLVLPWVFFPSVAKGIKSVFEKAGPGSVSLRFLISVILPAFLLFSLISGKQPHYLLPLAGPLLLLLFILAPSLKERAVKIVALGLVGALCLAHVIGAYTFLKPFNIDELLVRIKETPHEELAWARNYQNELGFLARLPEPIANLTMKETRGWLKDHPDGLLVWRYSPGRTDMNGINCFYSQAYRSKALGLCVLEGDPRTETTKKDEGS